MGLAAEAKSDMSCRNAAERSYVNATYHRDQIDCIMLSGS
jgi:hypothetical protein